MSPWSIRMHGFMILIGWQKVTLQTFELALLACFLLCIFVPRNYNLKVQWDVITSNVNHIFVSQCDGLHNKVKYRRKCQWLESARDDDMRVTAEFSQRTWQMLMSYLIIKHLQCVEITTVDVTKILHLKMHNRVYLVPQFIHTYRRTLLPERAGALRGPLILLCWMTKTHNAGWQSVIVLWKNKTASVSVTSESFSQ